MTEQDEAEGARVILLGAEANRQLFPGKAVIGQPLMVKRLPVHRHRCSRKKETERQLRQRPGQHATLHNVLSHGT